MLNEVTECVDMFAGTDEPLLRRRGDRQRGEIMMHFHFCLGWRIAIFVYSRPVTESRSCADHFIGLWLLISIQIRRQIWEPLSPVDGPVKLDEAVFPAL